MALAENKVDQIAAVAGASGIVVFLELGSQLTSDVGECLLPAGPPELTA